MRLEQAEPAMLRRCPGRLSGLVDAEVHEPAVYRLGVCEYHLDDYDASVAALANARENLQAAGVDQHVSLALRDLARAEKPEERGLVVCNPPYGHRLGDEGSMFLFYQSLGDVLKRVFDGWTAYVLAPHGNLKDLGLRPVRRHVLYNGAIDDKPSSRPSSLEGANNYIAAALDEAMAGKPVSVATSKPYGCSVKYR